MTTKAMKSLLTALAREASKSIRRPAEPTAVMNGFCRAMSVRVGRPVQLVLRGFPPDVPVTGLRLDCGDRSIIVVEERTAPEAQLVILGHELWHEECGHCDPHATTVTGDAVPTQYGDVQVRLTVSGGKVVKAEAVRAPKGGLSDQKTALAVPRLNREAVAAQSADIDAVSGATYTSGGYRRSLQSALDRAGG
ncbi:FMN-binding protein [Streptomyces seoulensis]